SRCLAAANGRRGRRPAADRQGRTTLIGMPGNGPSERSGVVPGRAPTEPGSPTRGEYSDRGDEEIPDRSSREGGALAPWRSRPRPAVLIFHVPCCISLWTFFTRAPKTNLQFDKHGDILRMGESLHMYLWQFGRQITRRSDPNRHHTVLMQATSL